MKKKKTKKQEIVLKVDNVYKDFYLPHDKSQSVKSAIIKSFSKHDKEVDTQHALRGISFEVKKGAFFGILGRNGSGKSTLLKILAEIYQPTKGKVKHKGKLVPFIELGVGFNPELTGRENVFLNGALLGFNKKEIEEKYDEIVKFAELENFMDQKLKNYSSGMQVRLAFSVATRSQADILLVDEVLAVGDADFQRKCYRFFKDLKNANKTVIFVSHDMSAVREFCTEAILINEGKITHQGSANKIANQYLKLFNVAEKDQEENGEEDDVETRWGSKKVEAKSIKVVKQTDDEIEIELKLKSNADEDLEIVAGLRAMDFMGKLVAGFNTEQRKKKIVVKAGQEKTLKITMPNIFGSGTYSIDLTVRTDESQGGIILDNWDNCLEVDIAKNYLSNFSITPSIELEES